MRSLCLLSQKHPDFQSSSGGSRSRPSVVTESPARNWHDLCGRQQPIFLWNPAATVLAPCSDCSTKHLTMLCCARDHRSPCAQKTSETSPAHSPIMAG